MLIYGIAVFSLGLFVATVLLNLPLLAVLFAAKRRLHPRVISLMAAGGFVVAGAWRMYQMEWYDSWRHGVPSASYLLTGYLPYLLAVGFIGWLVGALISDVKQRDLIYTEPA
jgi:hypothetical protein